MSTIPRTYLAFQHDAKLTTLSTIVRSIQRANTLDDASRAVFKGITIADTDHVVVTESTIFHPQGGGQPSDTGDMKTSTTTTSSSSPPTTFTVSAVRTDTTTPGQVLHLGQFNPSTTTTSTFQPGDTVTQSIDIEKRNLYSRYHTAGHVLGAAVRHLCQTSIPDFDELKASHFPGQASCEFQGLLDGKWKEPIQSLVDEYIDRDMRVEIDFWTEDDFRAHGLERLIPDQTRDDKDNGNGNSKVDVARGEKFRVVKIVGAEVYPCGGTHVDSTKECGKTTVRKISRSKGTSKVSYAV